MMIWQSGPSSARHSPGRGYDVRATGSAHILSRWVEAGDGDLVITDVVMPDENIFELLPRMKDARPQLPIVVMSAQTPS